jgi:Fe-S oxidoreductase/nitrate reductase gamma subunit
MNPELATREVFWNIGHAGIMYALLLPVLGAAGYGLYRRARRWRQGKPEARFDQPARRLALVVAQALLQQRTWRDRHAGALHALVFWGFVVLAIATTVVMIDHDFGVPVMHGWFYLVFQSLIVDLFGAGACIGVALAAWRRWVVRPPQLVASAEASLILVMLAAILATGFLVEGWRIAATADRFGAWSPFGWLVARASRPVLSHSALGGAHRLTWWLHMLLAFGFLAWAPYTKMMHALAALLNVYTGRLEPIGAALKPLDFEQAGALGASNLAALTWKDLLDLDACTECGRCTAACPAARVGKPLSPRDLILDLRRLSHARDDRVAPFIGATPALGPEALWACTTCAACTETCPVLIEPWPKIIAARRHLVMEEADFPATMQEAITSLEARGHPFAGSRFSRIDWTDGLDPPAPHAAAAGAIDVLLWAGCGGALVERNQRVLRALAQLLHKASVKFAILGRDETCTGDPARRIGQEFLFQTLARANIATLSGLGIREIVTACPHCLNTFRHEYPALGGTFTAWHHSEYLARLVDSGRLAPRPGTAATATYHDPCYLGRHNGVYEAPRRVLARANQGTAVEMEQNRERSFCCGGGGGLSFVDEPAGQRVNQERARQAVATGADVVAVGCPFCLTMLEDGVNHARGDRDVHVRDVAELLWESVRAESES